VWKESSEPAEARADLGGGLDRGRVVIELPEAEVPALESVVGFLDHVMGDSMQVAEERSEYYREEELPVLELEEPPNDWEGESNNGDEAAEETRGQMRPARIATMEERMEMYLRVATPDIPALFPRPAWDLSLRSDADAHDLVRTVDGYGADHVVQEKAEAEYRARREEAKVWRRRKDEEDRLVLEARAWQAQTYSEDIASRVERTMKNEEERMAELKRVKEAERVQIEEKKRIEEDRQLVEKRREAEKRKKEERKKREEEKRKEEEGRQKRRKAVEEATAQAKEEKRRREEQRELKPRANAEENKLFLVKEAERERLLAEEAKEQLAKRSAEAEKVRMARAEKDWQKLQEKEPAEGIPMGAPAFSYGSREADLSREACESLGNKRDQWNEATLKKGHWFDSDLCILEPVNSMQMVVFEQLKMAGLLCSRYSATVQKGRRFFTLAGKDMELPIGKGGKKKTASKRQRAASPAAPAPEGGSPVEGEMAGELLAVPGPSGMCAGSGGSEPPVPAGNSAAAVVPAAVEPMAAESAAIEPTVVELVVTELPPAVPAVEPERVQPEVSVAGLVDAELSEPVAQAAAAAPAAEAVTTVRLVSEALSALALTLEAEVPAGVPAAVEPSTATEAASAANGPAAASKECWVLNPAVGPKVTLRKLSVGLTAAAAETAAASVKCAGEPEPGSEMPPAARRAARETESPPIVMAPGPVPPTAAAAPVKRKAKAGVTGGSQKRRKSSPAKVKDL
jgi:hypothetical protein